jgi:K+-sensing histidine kinase KdpD
LQVVNNLLNNASKYSPNQTEIEIDVVEDEGELTVEVRDRGPGISVQNAEQLFDMFHRADDELTRSLPGTGIGLHVAKRIIEDHGGEITITSREGGGATALVQDSDCCRRRGVVVEGAGSEHCQECWRLLSAPAIPC